MANNAFVNVFRIKELRDRILFTIGILIVFRLGSVLTIPGIDPHALSAYFQSQVRGNAFVDYMDFFVGGAFSNFSVFMLGVMPYISTQILMQLALFVFPSLKKIAEDDGGRKKIQDADPYGICGIDSILCSNLLCLFDTRCYRASEQIYVHLCYDAYRNDGYDDNGLAWRADYSARYRKRYFDDYLCRYYCPVTTRRFSDDPTGAARRIKPCLCRYRVDYVRRYYRSGCL